MINRNDLKEYVKALPEDMQAEIVAPDGNLTETFNTALESLEKDLAGDFIAFSKTGNGRLKVLTTESAFYFNQRGNFAIAPVSQAEARDIAVASGAEDPSPRLVGKATSDKDLLYAGFLNRLASLDVKLPIPTPRQYTQWVRGSGRYDKFATLQEAEDGHIKYWTEHLTEEAEADA